MSSINKDTMTHAEMAKEATHESVEAEMRTEMLLSPPKKFSKAAIQLYFFMFLAYCSKQHARCLSAGRSTNNSRLMGHRI